MQSRLQTHLWAGALFAAAACGSPCGEREASDGEGAPRIEGLRLVEGAVPQDPWQLVLVADFRDNDGDLANGFAEVFLNGKAHESTIALFDVFRQSGLAKTATSGQLSIPLRFSEGTVSDGTEVELAIQLVDAAGLRSNCYSLELELDVSTARLDAARSRLRWALRACGVSEVGFDV